MPLASSEIYTRVSQYFEDRPDPGFGAEHIEMEVTVQGGWDGEIPGVQSWTLEGSFLIPLSGQKVPGLGPDCRAQAGGLAWDSQDRGNPGPTGSQPQIRKHLWDSGMMPSSGPAVYSSPCGSGGPAYGK